MLCHVALVRTDISEEHIATIIRVTRIGELGTTLAVTRVCYISFFSMQDNTVLMHLCFVHVELSSRLRFPLVCSDIPGDYKGSMSTLTVLCRIPSELSSFIHIGILSCPFVLNSLSNWSLSDLQIKGVCLICEPCIRDFILILPILFIFHRKYIYSQRMLIFCGRLCMLFHTVFLVPLGFMWDNHTVYYIKRYVLGYFVHHIL
jgi:hypothetical protein